MCELERERREDCSKVAPVLAISRTEETCAKLSFRESNLGERLGDCRLSGPGKTSEPEHAVVLPVLQPKFEMQESIPSRSLQATLSDPGTVPGVCRVVYTVENGRFLLPGHCTRTEGQAAGLTASRQRLSSTDRCNDI
jgi:hypothetical protein